MERKTNHEIRISFNSKDSLDDDLPLYRLVPLNRLHRIILRKQLTFTLTKSWEDVYEIFFLNLPFNMVL